MYDEHRPEDLDTDGEDHVADETRYFCMARPMKPVEVKVGTAGKNAAASILNVPEDNLRTVKMARMEVLE